MMSCAHKNITHHVYYSLRKARNRIKVHTHIQTDMYKHILDRLSMLGNYTFIFNLLEISITVVVIYRREQEPNKAAGMIVRQLRILHEKLNS
jgi:hypothetical protein